MAPGSLDASIVVDEEPEVEIEELIVSRLPANETYPPLSVSIYRLGAR